MGESTLVVSNLNGGEISPRVLGRTDLEAYGASAEEVLNWITMIQGGIERRPGTRFITNANDHAKRVRLVPFIVSPVDAHVLELSHFTLRILRDGGITLIGTFAIASSKDVDAITDEFSVVGHGYRNGDGPFRFTTSGTLPTGITAGTDYYIVLPPLLTWPAANTDEVNNEINVNAHGLSDRMGPFRFTGSSTLPGGLSYDTDYYVVTSGLVNPAANWFGVSLTPGGAKVDITNDGTGTHTLSPTPLYKASKFRVSLSLGGAAVNLTTAGSGLQTITPVTAAPLVVDLPYDENQVWELDFAQSADVMYLVHPSHKIRRLSRLSATGWLLEEIDPRDGPYLPENGTSVTIAASATTGIVTLTASSPIFSSRDAGRLFRKSTESGDTNSGLKWGYARISSVSGVDFSDPDIDQAIISATGSETDVANDQLTEVGHPFANLEGPVRLKVISGGLPGGLNQGVDYWIISTGANTFKLADSLANAIAGTPVDITSNGSGTFRVTTSVLEIAGHGILDQEGPLTLTTSGTLPQGLSAGTSYYAIRLSADSLQLSLTKGGAPVAIDSATGGGVHRINGSAGGTTNQVTATVLEAFPNITATTVWALGLYGPDSSRGYPAAVGFAEQRLVLGGAPGSKSRFDLSQAGDLENFAIDDSMDSSRESDKVSGTASGGQQDDHLITDASGIPYTIVSQESQQIRFLPGHRQLVVLTNGGIWPVQSSRDLTLVTPTDVTARMASNLASGGIKPVYVDDELIYISRLGKRVYGARWSVEHDAIQVLDRTLSADHVLNSPAVQLAYSQEPWSIVWVVRADGQLLALAHAHEQAVAAFSRHKIGGSFQGGIARVESVASIPDPNQLYDRLYLVVRRTVNGQDVRHIEFLTPRFDLADDVKGACFLDSSPVPFVGATATGTAVVVVNQIAFTGGDVDLVAAGFQVGDQVRIRATGSSLNGVVGTINLVTTSVLRFTTNIGTDAGAKTWTVDEVVGSVSGLTHLVGESVMVLADGMVQGPFTVSAGGVVTLSDLSNRVLVGFSYLSRLIGLPLQVLSTGEGRAELAIVPTRIQRMALRLFRTLGLKIGPTTDRMHEIPFRSPEDEMDAQLELFTGEYLVDPVDFGWSEDSTIVLETSSPLPAAVLRLAARVAWGSH